MLGKAGEVRLKAGTRIGVLCSQLRYVDLSDCDIGGSEKWIEADQ
jgi:hypothetical protein